MEDLENKKKERGKLKTAIIIILLVIVIAFIYIRFIETHGFVIKEFNVTSEKLPSNFNGLKIAHLSDIHYATVGKDDLDKVVDEINIMKPDIIVFTGDLHDEFTNLTDDMKEKLIDSLSKLEAPLGKYAVAGNHDYLYEGYEDLIKACSFTYLKNESKIIYYNGDTPIEIVGYPSMIFDEPNYDIELTDNYKIGLIHEGDAFDSIKDKGFNLVLAGHSHGGQVRIPIIGAIRFVDGGRKYYDQHYTYQDGELYINFGLGESKYKLRAFDRRSVNFYRLYTK